MRFSAGPADVLDRGQTLNEHKNLPSILRGWFHGTWENPLVQAANLRVHRSNLDGSSSYP